MVDDIPVYELVSKTHTGKSELHNSMQKLARNAWIIVREQDKVLFSQEKGPWALIRPLEADRIIGDMLSRWVHLSDDKDFRLRLLNNVTENYD